MSQAEPTINDSFVNLKGDAWMQAVETAAEEDGHFHRVGKEHYAILVERQSTLLVTFETLQGMRALSSMAQPLGWDMVRDHDWSHLCLASDGDTWFRDPAIYAYFDRLIDDGFFDEFDRVVFYGAGPCAYAAAAYSVAAPGAKVLAIQPQATIDPRIADWDDRFTDMRRADFTSRYGYAPDMLDAVDHAFILYDPAETLDAMHAALFTRSNVTKLRLRHMGDALQTDLLEMGLLQPMLLALAANTLDYDSFADLYRARRDYPPYLRNLMGALDGDGRTLLVRALCRNVTSRMRAPRFTRRLAELDAIDKAETPLREVQDG